MIEKFDPKAQKTVTVSDSAAAHFKRYLEQKGGIGIEITVKKTGCSGLQYVLEATDVIPDNHELCRFQEVDFYVDLVAFRYLNGLEIDYVKQDLGLSKLVYHNPNEAARCGCGESFTIVADEE
ncbi:MAG: HesB/IscA family protein [Francisellaceae bacterium]